MKKIILYFFFYICYLIIHQCCVYPNRYPRNIQKGDDDEETKITSYDDNVVLPI